MSHPLWAALHSPFPGRAAFFLLTAAAIQAAEAAPYVPEKDSTVVATVPVSDELEKLAPLRETVRKQPDNAQAAYKLAHRYLELGRGQDDPRFVGYARSVLQPWLDKPTPSLDMLVLQATIEQYQHNFHAALSLLNEALKRHPGHPQALLTRATVLQVLGKLEQATHSCKTLLRSHPGLSGITCLTAANSLRGELDRNYRLLKHEVNTNMSTSPEVKSWALSHLAEMAVRQGNKDAARLHYRAALRLTPDNGYLLAAYSDLLLEQGHPEKVLDLLRNRERQDALLLRLAIAGVALNDPRTEDWSRELEARFEAARMRGDTAHKREEARYWLEVRNNPDKAAKLARQNWELQHEPDDLLLLLRSSFAAGKPETAKPALEWIDRHGYEDARLNI